eukprot:COSAG05_NODE_809_length_7187_cov_20.173109_1_plen_479_part_10
MSHDLSPHIWYIVLHPIICAGTDKHHVCSMGTCFATVFFLYPMLSSTVFRMFLCRDLDYGERWHYDQFDVDCTATQHQLFQLLAVVGAAVYPFGVPLYFFVNMYRNREHLAEEETTETHNNASQTDLKITNTTSNMHRDALLLAVREGKDIARSDRFTKLSLRYRLKQAGELQPAPKTWTEWQEETEEAHTSYVKTLAAADNLSARWGTVRALKGLVRLKGKAVGSTKAETQAESERQNNDSSREACKKVSDLQIIGTGKSATRLWRKARSTRTVVTISKGKVIKSISIENTEKELHGEENDSDALRVTDLAAGTVDAVNLSAHDGTGSLEPQEPLLWLESHVAFQSPNTGNESVELRPGAMPSATGEEKAGVDLDLSERVKGGDRPRRPGSAGRPSSAGKLFSKQSRPRSKSRNKSQRLLDAQQARREDQAGRLRQKTMDICYHCKQPGHWKKSCPHLTDTERSKFKTDLKGQLDSEK